MNKLVSAFKEKNIAAMTVGFLAAIVIAAVFVVMTCLHPHRSVGFFRGDENVRVLDEGWILDDGSRKIEIDLPSRTDHGITSENVVLTNTLPAALEEGDVMMYRSSLQGLKVYVDGNEVYSYGEPEYRLFGKNNGSIYNIIPLLKSYAGKEIRLEINSPYNDYKNTFNTFFIGKYPEIMSLLMKEHMPDLFLTILLFVIGILMLLVFISTRLYGISKNRQSLWLGLFALCIAGWEFTECKLTQVFADNMVGASAAGFMLLALMPIPLLIFFDETEVFRFHTIYLILVYACVLNVFVQVILQMTGVRDFYQLFVLSMCMIIISSIAIIVLAVINYMGNRDRRMIPFLVALAILVLLGCGEFINMFRFGMTDGDLLNVGMLIFVIVCSTRTLLNLVGVVSSGQKAVIESAEKTAFLANMSHEIRTPMNAICAMSEMLKGSDTLSPRDRDRVKVISLASDNLLCIINDILDFSKLTTDKLVLRSEAYELPDLIYEACTPIAALAESKRLDFKVSISPDVPERLQGDAERVRQILMNLASNAVKYTKKGSVNVCVDSQKEEGDRVRLVFTVSDTGIGIKRDALSKIFDAYSQVDVKRERAEDSTGLGLAISKGLAMAMEGDIMVQSSEETGSIFTANLVQKALVGKSYYEYVRDSERGIVYIEDRIRFVHAEKQSWNDKDEEVNIDASKARILVVDDNSTNLRIMREMLSSFGNKPVLVSSGVQALAAMRAKPFDLIFMDHMMPNMDGIETATEIRKMKDVGGDKIKIVALTADALKGADKKFFENGFDAYLAKPVTLQQIVHTLEVQIPDIVIKGH
ncbi:MAG: response regulator [Lachnospiraceae bacterium]|nr:response regulator [Lachnospiraceae bacterium]